MAFCTNCGKKVEDYMKFCTSCGAPVEEVPQAPQTPSAPQPTPQPAAAVTDLLEKVLTVLKRNYKLVGIIGIAALAVVLMLLLFSQCSGGGTEESFLNQFQGYWEMQTHINSAGGATLEEIIFHNSVYVDRPRAISITKNAVQIDDWATCPISETEYKDGALYFSAQWYESVPIDGQEPGIQNYDLRLTYDKSDKRLLLEVELSDGWFSLSDYARVD